MRMGAYGYGEATRESRHTMSFELMRSNSELMYDSNEITNDVINLPFLYGRSGFVNNLNELFGGIGAFPEGHVGENTGYNYADSNKKRLSFKRWFCSVTFHILTQTESRNPTPKDRFFSS